MWLAALRCVHGVFVSHTYSVFVAVAFLKKVRYPTLAIQNTLGLTSQRRVDSAKPTSNGRTQTLACDSHKGNQGENSVTSLNTSREASAPHSAGPRRNCGGLQSPKSKVPVSQIRQSIRCRFLCGNEVAIKFPQRRPTAMRSETPPRSHDPQHQAASDTRLASTRVPLLGYLSPLTK